MKNLHEIVKQSQFGWRGKDAAKALQVVQDGLRQYMAMFMYAAENLEFPENDMPSVYETRQAYMIIKDALTPSIWEEPQFQQPGTSRRRKLEALETIKDDKDYVPIPFFPTRMNQMIDHCTDRMKRGAGLIGLQQYAEAMWYLTATETKDGYILWLKPDQKYYRPAITAIEEAVGKKVHIKRGVEKLVEDWYKDNMDRLCYGAMRLWIGNRDILAREIIGKPKIWLTVNSLVNVTRNEDESLLMLEQFSHIPGFWEGLAIYLGAEEEA